MRGRQLADLHSTIFKATVIDLQLFSSEKPRVGNASRSRTLRWLTMHCIFYRTNFGFALCSQN